MNVELALKVNKYIHEQCIDGVPHDIGWNVMKLIEAESGAIGESKNEPLYCDHCGASKMEGLDHCLCFSGSTWLKERPIR